MQRDTNRTGSRPAGPAPRGSFSFRRIRSDQAQVHRSGGSRDSRNCEEKTMGYFHPIYRDKHTVLPGVGTIHSHSVGSTSHTTGFDHYFMPEGAEKELPGHVRFSTFIHEDGRIAWRFAYATGPISRQREGREPRPAAETPNEFPQRKRTG